MIDRGRQGIRPSPIRCPRFTFPSSRTIKVRDLRPAVFPRGGPCAAPGSGTRPLAWPAVPIHCFYNDFRPERENHHSRFAERTCRASPSCNMSNAEKLATQPQGPGGEPGPAISPRLGPLRRLSFPARDRAGPTRGRRIRHFWANRRNRVGKCLSTQFFRRAHLQSAGQGGEFPFCPRTIMGAGSAFPRLSALRRMDCQKSQNPTRCSVQVPISWVRAGLMGRPAADYHAAGGGRPMLPTGGVLKRQKRLLSARRR